MNDIIRFEQVTKAYGDQVILKAFDLKIRKGEFLTVIGSSGSGKTTMLKLINGLSAPTQGKIYIDGNARCWIIRHIAREPNSSTPQYRLCHPGNRTVSSHDCPEKYRLCTEPA